MLVRYSTDEKGNPVKKAVVYTKEEHCIKRESIDPDAIFIIDCLKKNGFDSYIVGGAVRDLIGGGAGLCIFSLEQKFLKSAHSVQL